MLEALIGRQPIYDRDLNVIAYELLYRSTQDSTEAVITDGNHATTQVIINSFMEIGLESIVGNATAFINMTRDFIVGNHPLPFEPKDIVLEILEDIEVDEEIITSVKKLSEAGFTLALDDFILNDALRPLLDLVKIVKVELPALTKEQIREHVTELRKYDLLLLAEKIETQEEFAYCKELGFDYFQGYFLSKPNTIKSKRTPANRLATMRILAKLQNPATSMTEIEELIAQDVTLSFKVLKYINSAAFSLPKKIESIKQAVIYLGNKVITHWATLIVMSGIDDKPIALMSTALVRSKMCELIAIEMGLSNTASFATAGLLSTLDSIMDKPMSEVIEELPLSEEINNALLQESCIIGDVLQCVIAYDYGKWDDTKHLKLAPQQLSNCYLKSIAWASAITNELTR